MSLEKSLSSVQNKFGHDAKQTVAYFACLFKAAHYGKQKCAVVTHAALFQSCTEPALYQLSIS